MARLVAVKCPNCGANVRVDPERELATCDYCHTSSFVQTKQRRVTDEIRHQHPMVIDVSSGTNKAIVTLIVIGAVITAISVASSLGFALWRASSSSTRPTPQKTTALEVELDRNRDTRFEQTAGIAAAELPSTPTAESPSESPSPGDAAHPGGGTRPKPSAVPEVSKVAAGAVTVSGRLDPKLIGALVRQNFGRFRMCHEQALARAPNTTGTVRVRFVIGRDGSVSNVSNGGSDVPDAALTSCILSAFYGLSFPKPEGGIVTVVYPLILRTEPARPR